MRLDCYCSRHKLTGSMPSLCHPYCDRLSPFVGRHPMFRGGKLWNKLVLGSVTSLKYFVATLVKSPRPTDLEFCIAHVAVRAFTGYHVMASCSCLRNCPFTSFLEVFHKVRGYRCDRCLIPAVPGCLYMTSGILCFQ